MGFNLTQSRDLCIVLHDEDGQPLTTTNGKLETNVTLVADIVGVGNIYGYDNNPSGWVQYSGTPEEGNTVTVTVGSIQKVYTVQSGDTLEDISAGVAALFNADNDFKADFIAKTFQDITFFRAREQGDAHEGTALTVVVAQGSGSGLNMSAVTNSEDNELAKKFKKILVELDAEDERVGRIGVFGEVGTRTRADNPIFLSVRKSLATNSETLFFDKNVTDLTNDPNIALAFITDFLVADDVGGELRIYKGISRDRVENDTGDGSTKNFGLDYNAVGVASHVVVTVDSVQKVINTDYDIIDDPNDSSKSMVSFKSAPASAAAIQTTYDACQRLLVLFVQASSSQGMSLGAPVKLEKESSHFLVATVVNKSANAAVVAVNANGFYELERGVVA